MKAQPKIKVFNHIGGARDAQYPNYNAWADAARSKGYEIIELYDDGPNEIAGSGPWGAFKNNRRMGMFENGRGGTLDRAVHDDRRALSVITNQGGGKYVITNKKTGETRTARSQEQAEEVAARWGMYEWAKDSARDATTYQDFQPWCEST